VLAWGTLAWSLCVALRARGLGLVAAALVLALAQSPRIASWNDCVLSESLSLSCYALTVAAALAFVRRPARWAGPLALGVLALALARDSNAFLVLGLVPALIGFALWLRWAARRPAWPAWLVAGCAVAAFVLGNASSNHGKRWAYPLVNVVVWRVLPDAELREAFEARGMPQLRGLRANRQRKAFDRDASLAPFYSWLEQDGKHAYVGALLSKPLYLLGRPLRELDVLIGSELADYAPRRTEPRESSLVDALWRASAWWWQGLVAAVLSVAVLSVPALRRAPVAWLGAIGLWLVYPHALVAWHGDAMEVARHGLQAAVQLQLAFLLLLIAAADVAALKLRDWRRSAPDPKTT
jgi:hypothetical protein